LEVNDALTEMTSVYESRALPTVDEIREVLLRNDSYGVLREAMLPGLMLDEWEAKKEEEGEEEEEEKDRPRRRFTPARAMGRFAETIVRVDRVQKVVKGGVITRYRALVVVGNLMGAGGYAFGKGASPQDAVARASQAAKRDLHFFDRFMDTALTHDVRGKHNNCTVDIFATPPGAGPKGGKLGRAILTQLGFSSFTIASHGRRTPASYVYATFNALNTLRSVEDIARSRGRRILEIDHALRWDRKVTTMRTEPLKNPPVDALKAHVDASTELPPSGVATRLDGKR